MQEESKYIQEAVREGILTSNSLRIHQHCKVTMIVETKNKNGKRNP
jgi:hypothetical protein